MPTSSTRKKRLLFICGSINQTTQMHQIARELPEYEHAFTSYYGNADFDIAQKLGWMESTIGGKKLTKRTNQYLQKHDLPMDYAGRTWEKTGGFDLAFQCSDLIRPNNLWGKKVILVQEGMTDPPSVFYPVWRRLWWKGVPIMAGWIAGTSTFGLSGQYTKMCVASEGYRDAFIRRGAREDRVVVTGMPNFDDCDRYRKNDFPHRDYLLVCTSDTREVFWFEDRKALLERVVKLARGRQIIFKLHPNEIVDRAKREIEEFAPGSIVYTTGPSNPWSAEEMIANCETLVCTYSTVAFVGLALGKELYSRYDIDELRKLLPVQNKCAAKNIADVARELLGDLGPGESERRIRARAEGSAAERASAPDTSAGAVRQPTVAGDGADA
jgi:hypothetical protein